MQKNNLRGRRVGLELENLLLNPDAGLISKSVVQQFWQDFIALGWKEKRDSISGEILATQKEFDGQSVVASTDGSLSTFELALPPLYSIQEEENLLEHLHVEILPIFKKYNLRLLGIGLNPGHTSVGDEHLTGKSFYKTVKRFWHLFNLGFGTAANQTNISVRIDEVIPSINALTAISGLMTALTSNSSIADWRILPWKEFRQPLFSKLFCVTDYPSFQTVVCNAPKNPFVSLSKYLLDFLDAEPFMIITPMRDGQFVVLDKKVTWLEYLKGREWTGIDLAGNKKILKPDVSDINMAMNNQWYPTVLHMVCDENKTSVDDFVLALEQNNIEQYLDGKLNNLYIEYRIASAQLKGEEFNCPALIMGLAENLSELEKLVSRYDWSDWVSLSNSAAIIGMDAKIKDATSRELLSELIEIARHGLRQRNLGEETYLNLLEKRLTDNRAPSDDVNEFFNTHGKEGLMDYLSYV